jgi:3-isopropylmalate/(R)-2-methylmalate dehydratase small subunit
VQSMDKFTSLEGVAAPLKIINVDTDMIIPKQYLKTIKRTGLAKGLFSEQRYKDDGSENPDFVLNQPQFRQPGILVTGHNFGAGSSREAAVWGMLANDIRVIVARSFADIYRENCLQNGLLPIVLAAAAADAFEQRVVAVNGASPFTVDLESQRITGPGGPDIAFDLPAADRMRLLEGLDDIGLTLKHADEIAGWERRIAADQPWLQSAADHRT